MIEISPPAMRALSRHAHQSQPSLPDRGPGVEAYARVADAEFEILGSTAEFGADHASLAVFYGVTQRLLGNAKQAERDLSWDLLGDGFAGKLDPDTVPLRQIGAEAPDRRDQSQRR